MNQDAAHSFRLHHTRVTDVINAKPRVDATRTLTGKGSQPHCCYLNRCSQTLRGHAVRVTSRLSSCTKMPSPPIIRGGISAHWYGDKVHWHLRAKKSAYTEGIERLLIKARLLIERHVQAVLGVLERWPLLRD